MARRTGALALAIGLGAASAGWGDTLDAPPAPPTRFKCELGGDIRARFAVREEQLVAIVDAGDGPHALAARPWTEGPVRLVWSDGQRTLTWTPGVRIMWTDGPEHRHCGRGEHRH